MELTRISPTPSLDTLYGVLLDMWSAYLPEEILDEGASRKHENLLVGIAVQLFLSQFGVMFVPEKLLPSIAVESRNDGIEFEQLPRQWLPSPSATESVAASSSRATTPGEAGEEDDAVMRLRQYALITRTTVPKRKAEPRVLSHWEVGGDPNEYVWLPPGARDVAGAAASRKKREEAHRRRRAERLGLQRSDIAEPSSQLTAAAPQIRSSQPSAAPHIHSNQAGWPSSQQSFSSQPTSQPTSQPFGMPHGARSGRKKPRPKKVPGF